MTPTNEAGHGLPERALAAWAGKHRTDAENRAFIAGYETCQSDMNAALSLSRGVPDDMVPRALVRDLIVGAYNAGTQGVGFTQQLMELPDAPAAAGAQGDEGCDCMGCGEIYSHGEGWFTCPYCKGTGKEIKEPQPAAADGGVRERDDG